MLKFAWLSQVRTHWKITCLRGKAACCMLFLASRQVGAHLWHKGPARGLNGSQTHNPSTIACLEVQAPPLSYLLLLCVCFYWIIDNVPCVIGFRVLEHIFSPFHQGILLAVTPEQDTAHGRITPREGYTDGSTGQCYLVIAWCSCHCRGSAPWAPVRGVPGSISSQGSDRKAIISPVPH